MKHAIINVLQSCFELDRDVIVLGANHLLAVGANQTKYITIGLNRRCEPSLQIRSHVDVDPLVCCSKSDGCLVLHRDWLHQARSPKRRPGPAAPDGAALWSPVGIPPSLCIGVVGERRFLFVRSSQKRGWLATNSAAPAMCVRWFSNCCTAACSAGLIGVCPGVAMAKRQRSDTHHTPIGVCGRGVLPAILQRASWQTEMPEGAS